jgi:hypothetical protein
VTSLPQLLPEASALIFFNETWMIFLWKLTFFRASQFSLPPNVLPSNSACSFMVLAPSSSTHYSEAAQCITSVLCISVAFSTITSLIHNRIYSLTTRQIQKCHLSYRGMDLADQGDAGSRWLSASVNMGNDGIFEQARPFSRGNGGTDRLRGLYDKRIN